MLINLPLIKAPRNVMPINLRRNLETYGIESVPPFEFTSRAIEAFHSCDAEFKKPRPAGLKEKMAEVASTEIGFDLVGLGSDFPGSDSFPSLLQVEEALDQSQETSPALINEPLKLEFLDFGDEFRLESFELPVCSEQFYSRNLGETSSSTLELAVETLISASPEPNTKSGRVCSVNLETSRIDASAGDPAMRDPSVFATELDATMECTMARCEVDPHRFQPENRSAESEYVGNYPTSVQAAQMSRRPDHGYRGRFSSHLTPSYPRLHPAQSYTRAFTMPTMGRDELEQRLCDLRKNIRLSVQFETNEPQKAPDKFLEAAGRCDHTTSQYADLVVQVPSMLLRSIVNKARTL